MAVESKESEKTLPLKNGKSCTCKEQCLCKTHRVTLWLTDEEFQDLEKLQDITRKSKPDLFYELFKQRMFLVMFDWCYIPVNDFKFLLSSLTPDQLLDYSHLIAEQMSESSAVPYFNNYADIIAKWAIFNHSRFDYDKLEETIHWKHPYGRHFSQAFSYALEILADADGKKFLWKNIGETTFMGKMTDLPAEELSNDLSN